MMGCLRKELSFAWNKNIGREAEKRHGDLSNKNGGRIWYNAGMMGL
jgi:hypothetical protein